MKHRNRLPFQDAPGEVARTHSLHVHSQVPVSLFLRFGGGDSF